MTRVLLLLLPIALAGCATTASPEPSGGPPSEWPRYRPDSRQSAEVLLTELIGWADQSLAAGGCGHGSRAATARTRAEACLTGRHEQPIACKPANDAEHYRLVERAWQRIDREVRVTGAVPPCDSPAWSDRRSCMECLASISPVSAGSCLDHAGP